MQLYVSVLLAAITLSIAACTGISADTDYTPDQIAQVIIASQTQIPVMHQLLPGDSYYTEYLDTIYLLGNREVADGAIFYTEGMQADEIAVFLFNDGGNISNAKNMLKGYINRRISAFTGYAPQQAAILENGCVISRGNYIALIVCSDEKAAQSAFSACFSENPPDIPKGLNIIRQIIDEESVIPELIPDTQVQVTPEAAETPAATAVPEPADDIYDHGAIIAAWTTGDTSGLTKKNKAIFDICSSIINTIITNDMNEYEKELAIHDWIIGWAGYDTEANSNAPDAQPDPDNDNPYGLLLNRKAICTGYTYTFQLFMDLLGIECITVHGTARTGGDHAWNMVRINDEWYCVDTTWNDPTDGDANHKYFNVPNRVLREAGHTWDNSSIPEATAPQLYLVVN